MNIYQSPKCTFGFAERDLGLLKGLAASDKCTAQRLKLCWKQPSFLPEQALQALRAGWIAWQWNFTPADEPEDPSQSSAKKNPHGHAGPCHSYLPPPCRSWSQSKPHPRAVTLPTDTGSACSDLPRLQLEQQAMLSVPRHGATVAVMGKGAGHCTVSWCKPSWTQDTRDHCSGSL